MLTPRYIFPLARTLKKHSIVPEIIDVSPQSTAEITYPEGIKVEPGNELAPKQVKTEPSVKWPANDDTLYTLCMADLDAPRFREWQQWLWLVGNIPGSDVSRGETLSAYVGAGPLRGTGLHRYLFLIYKQARALNFERKRFLDFGNGSDKFAIRRFAANYELGQPVAGNFFQARWDGYVPFLDRRAGFLKVEK